jgi:hypothetical protein
MRALRSLSASLGLAASVKHLELELLEVLSGALGELDGEDAPSAAVLSVLLRSCIKAGDQARRSKWLGREAARTSLSAPARTLSSGNAVMTMQGVAWPRMRMVASSSRPMRSGDTSDLEAGGIACRSCSKGRHAPPVHRIRPIEEREFTPYVWVHEQTASRADALTVSALEAISSSRGSSV